MDENGKRYRHASQRWENNVQKESKWNTSERWHPELFYATHIYRMFLSLQICLCWVPGYTSILPLITSDTLPFLFEANNSTTGIQVPQTRTRHKVSVGWEIYKGTSGGFDLDVQREKWIDLRPFCFSPSSGKVLTNFCLTVLLSSATPSSSSFRSLLSTGCNPPRLVPIGNPEQRLTTL